KKANIDPLEILTLEQEEEDVESDDEITESAEESDKASEGKAPGSPSRASGGSSGSQAANPNLPFAILSPDPHALESGDEPVGRKFPWGFADPYNPEHCDFGRLKESVFSDWRSELREASRVIWY